MPVSIPITIVTKSPDSDLSYGWDWSDWLDSAASPSPVLSASVWYIVSPVQGSPADMTLSNQNISGSIAEVKVSGGKENTVYRLRNHVTASDGEQDDVYIDIAVMP